MLVVNNTSKLFVLGRISTTKQSKRFIVQRIVSAVKDNWKKKREEHDENFQTWAEFQNRGFRKPDLMRSWIIEQYGAPEEVLQLETIDLPYHKFKSHVDARREYLVQAVTHPNNVLIKVHAASLNPIDIRMCQGYGSTLFNFRRNMLFSGIASSLSYFKSSQEYKDREFPLVLGRDFSGTVVDVGSGVFDIQPGDEVYGAPNLYQPGTLSNYICADLSEVVQRPATLSHVDAASIPYVGLTVASALRDFVSNPISPKRALILGGSGGIGTFAIQYLQAYGFSATVTCSTEGVTICNRLGAECIDYKQQDVSKTVKELEKFSLVFDPIGAASPEWANAVLVKGGTYVSLKSPIVKLTDKYGLVAGSSQAALVAAKQKLFNSAINVHWGFFKPDRQALLEISRIIDGGLIKPVINTTNIFSFEDVPNAFKVLSAGHTKGKIVVNVSGLPEAIAKPAVERVVHL